LLHLAPGALAVLAYLFICVPLAAALGLPRQVAFLLMDVLVLLPILLVFLYWLGSRRNGRLSLTGIVLNRRKLPAVRLMLLVGGLFAWAVVVIALLSPVDAVLLERLFYWVPAALLPEDSVAAYPSAVLFATHLLSIVIVGVVAPVVEEMYFRGYLLPRVPWTGIGAPVWNTILFTIYHFWSPWRFVTRVVFGLPMVYTVWRTRSISVGLWWHCLGNVIGEIVTLVAVLRTVKALG
jgi:membrane protease YdiL (CAAX protease family)